jgi:hypothetical protein
MAMVSRRRMRGPPAGPRGTAGSGSIASGGDIGALASVVGGSAAGGAGLRGGVRLASVGRDSMAGGTAGVDGLSPPLRRAKAAMGSSSSAGPGIGAPPEATKRSCLSSVARTSCISGSGGLLGYRSNTSRLR